MPDAQHLRSLGVSGLADVVRHHALTVRLGEPQNVDQLAALLDGPVGTLLAVRLLPTPDLQVLEALVDLRGRVALDDLCGRLGAEGDRARRVEAALGRLVTAGLVVPAEGEFSAVLMALNLLNDPFGLGPPFADLAQDLRADDLKVVLSSWSASTAGRKADLVGRLTQILGDRDSVLRCLRQLSPETARIVAEAAAGVEMPTFWSPYWGQARRPHEEALRYGLLFSVDGYLVVPKEVAQALMPADWRPPFDPDPPPTAWVPTDPQLLARESSAAAAGAVRLVTQVVEAAVRRPVQRRKDGVIGPREVKRLAKECGSDELDVVQALDLALLGSFLGAPKDPVTLVPGPAFEEWLELPPARRAAVLARLWWLAPQAVRTGGRARPLPCLDCAPFVAALRRAVLSFLREGALELGAPAATATPGQVAQVVAWRLPLAVDHLAGRDEKPLDVDPLAPDLINTERDELADRVRATVEATLAEAAWLGLVAVGALTRSGSALLRGDLASLEEGLASLGELQATARIQADLTAVVLGVPEPGLTRTLDLLADRESSGTAVAWRFTPSSVRRGFDTGIGADEVLSRLRAASEGSLPQALEYLVGDVARRHGHLQVGDAACYLIARDTGLAAEVARDRTLRQLELRVVAGVVLVGSRSRAETLTALRTAGYAPVDAAGGEGQGVIARLPREPHDAGMSTTLLEQRLAGLAASPAAGITESEAVELAERLLAAPGGSPGGPMFSEDLGAFEWPWNDDPGA